MKESDNPIASELLGTWWLPGNEQDAIPGTLKYDQRGHIELQTMGFLFNEAGQPSFSSSHAFNIFPYVLGRLRDGKHLTLRNAHVVREGISKDGDNYQDLKATLLFLGSHF